LVQLWANAVTIEGIVVVVQERKMGEIDISLIALEIVAFAIELDGEGAVRRGV
jgi:hypothetical protein